MADLSYFEEAYESLVSEAVYDSETGELISEAVYETRQRIRPRPLGKSFEDVSRVANKHKGARDDVIDQFVALYLEALQWRWYDSYIKWQTDHAQWVIDNQIIIDWNLANPEDLRDELIEPVEPPQIPQITVEQWKIENATLLREAAYPTQRQQLAAQRADILNNTTLCGDAFTAIDAQYPAA